MQHAFSNFGLKINVLSSLRDIVYYNSNNSNCRILLKEINLKKIYKRDPFRQLPLNQSELIITVVLINIQYLGNLQNRRINTPGVNRSMSVHPSYRPHCIQLRVFFYMGGGKNLIGYLPVTSITIGNGF